jgi:hypothetical protein
VARFFFHFSSREDSVLDTDGAELRDLRAAHAHALGIIHDMMAMFSDAEDWRGWREDHGRGLADPPDRALPGSRVQPTGPDPSTSQQPGFSGEGRNLT